MGLFPVQLRGALGKRGVGEIFGGLFLDLNLEALEVEKVTRRGLSSNNYTPKLSPTQNYLGRHLDGKKGLSVCFHPFFTMGRARWALKCEEFGQEAEIE